MAHEIETHGDQAAAVFARQDAWHKLGTTLPHGLTAEDVMTHGHLGGWNVRKLPLQAVETTEDGVTVTEVADQHAIARTNPFTGGTDVLGVVGNGYRPIQNEEHIKVLQTLVDDSGAEFDTAGSLRGGRETFITMKVPAHMKIGGIDAVDTYIAALNSHDGRSAFRLLATSVRVVCANTQAAALKNNTGMFSIRHTAISEAMIGNARDALGLCFDYLDGFQSEAEKMIQETLTEGQFMDIIRAAYGPEEDAGKRKRENAEKVISDLAGFWHGPANREIIGTRWGAYQAVTEYVDWAMPVRSGDRAEDAVRAEKVLTDPGFANAKLNAFDMFAVGV